MAKGDTKTNQYLDIAANGTRADLPTDTCCETRSQTLIREVAERIITEEETRYREDQILQSEIDEIKNNPDVADIVPTYAALQDYDTSKLTDQDIIRVLADETHEGASTYYRWSTSSQTFTYVGETGDYYTKSQVDDLLDNKQDLLTAGDGITIEEESGALVISSTGGGGGTSNFNQLTNRPKYNGATMTGSTDIPEVKTYSAGTGLDLTDTTFSADTTVLATKTDLEGKQDELTAGDNVTIEDESGALVISATDTTYSNFTGTDGTAVGVAGLVPAPATTDAGKFLSASGLWEEVAGGGGGVTELTSADYNWPTNNPDGVAAWNLTDGYYKSASAVKIYASSTRPLSTSASKKILISSTSSAKTIYSFGGNGNMEATVTVIDNGSETSHYTYKNPNILQTTGSSTTDVMSQNATTNAINAISQSGAGAPTTSTVGTVGQLYQDTTNGDLYICTDATNPYVWEEVGAGGGSGPTVVQTTGTSTTDVMSQNAVTSMVYADPSVKQKVQIGASSQAAASRTTVVGTSAYATRDRAVALGDSAYASALSSVAIGRASNATVQGQFDIGDSYSGGYNNSRYRLLTGVYDPQSAHDAATKGYVDTAVAGAAYDPTISNNTLYL